MTFNILAGSNDKSVIAWDLTGNLTIDSELSRNIGTKWFVNDPEKVVYTRLYIYTIFTDILLLTTVSTYNGHAVD